MWIRQIFLSSKFPVIRYVPKGVGTMPVMNQSATPRLLTAKEINLAERYWIQSIQLEEFSTEIAIRQSTKLLRVD